MALSAIDKNLLISAMERGLGDAKEAAGVASLAALETEVTGLRTDYDADPATVTAAEIMAAYTKVSKFVIPTLASITAVISEATTEAAG